MGFDLSALFAGLGKGAQNLGGSIEDIGQKRQRQQQLDLQQQTPLDWYNSISGAPASNMAYNPNGVMAAPSLGFDPNEMDPRYYGGSNGV